MNSKFQKLDADKLEQVNGGVGATMEIRPVQTGTAFVGGTKFASISGLTLPELNAIGADDPRYGLAREYLTFLNSRAQATLERNGINN